MPVLSSLVRYPQKCVCVYSVRCSINMTPVALIVGLALKNIIECTMVCACPSPPSSCPPSYSLLKAVPKRSRKQIAAHQKSSIFDNILGPSGSPMAIVVRIILFRFTFRRIRDFTAAPAHFRVFGFSALSSSFFSRHIGHRYDIHSPRQSDNLYCTFHFQSLLLPSTLSQQINTTVVYLL